MSFRTRLTIFVAMIAIVPMVAVAVLLTQISGSARTGKADARLSTGLSAALEHYRSDITTAGTVVQRAAQSERARLAIALTQRDTDLAGEIARDVLSRLDIASVEIRDAQGQLLGRAGSKDGIARAQIDLQARDGSGGSISIAKRDPTDFMEEVAALTDQQVAIVRGRKVLASNVDVNIASAPLDDAAGTFKRAGQELRFGGAPLQETGRNARVVLFAPLALENGVGNRPLMIVAIAAFFSLAMFLVMAIIRALNSQVGEVLVAAQQIGAGDFSSRVPVHGNDELAKLASEFNIMTERLSLQVTELQNQRTELDRSVRRIGEAVASGLDRRALMGIMIETALAASASQYGRVVLLDDERDSVEGGVNPTPDMRATVDAAELATGRDRNAAEAHLDPYHAVSYPMAVPGEINELLGVVTMGRAGNAYSAEERDALHFLINRAALSIRNVHAHEAAAEAALTDDLTDLPNKRHFREWASNEAARVRRFEHDFGLLIMDIDNFKLVNDTLGHPQGDEVLRVVGKILREEARAVDLPARFGGEEFVMGLAETDKGSAYAVAERVRERIAHTVYDSITGGAPISITVSIGVAAMTEDAMTLDELIEAADQALYRAKNNGKNCTELAVFRADGAVPP